MESIIRKLPFSQASSNHLQLKLSLHSSETSLDSLKTNQLTDRYYNNPSRSWRHCQAVCKTDGLTNFEGKQRTT